MKRSFLFLSSFLLSSFGFIYSQGEMDAYNLSNGELKGTARSVAMGGAFGALGRDISSISINPAGIGVYDNASEVATTLNFQNTTTKTNLNAGQISNSKFKFNFDNIGFASSTRLNNDVAPFLNLGFSYNRLKNFDRKYNMIGDNVPSVANYMALRATRNGASSDQIWLSDRNNYSYNQRVFENNDWLSIFGYNSYLISSNGGTSYSPSSIINGVTTANDLLVRENGSVDSYDFNIGTTFEDLLSVGLSFSVTDINYNMYSSYVENYDGGNGFSELQNWMKTEGTGYQINLGVILKPIEELRIGVAYHSPTWYQMTDYYSAQMNYNMNAYLTSTDSYPSDNINSGDWYTNYRLRTPDRWTFSLAGFIGSRAILSADYEYTNYGSNMRLFNDNGDELLSRPNAAIKDHYKGASTLRLGAEIRITKQFSARVGYAWMQSPLTKEFKNGYQEVGVVGSTPNYILDGDKNNFTYGLGYRFTKNFYTDVAFVMSSRKSDLYTFYGADPASFKTNTFQGLLTLGYYY